MEEILMTECNPFLTPRFDLALLFASGLHRTQCRKKTNIPYISHLMAVSALVLEAGGDEDLAIAALLHDAAEDQGGQAILDDIRRLFGDRVADVIGECSDTLLNPKPPSEKRKAAYLIHLRKASPDALLVSAADKLHNARAILFDYRQYGEEVFSRFNVGKEGQLDYYGGLFDSFTKRCAQLEEYKVSGVKRLVAELGRVVEKLKTLTQSPELRRDDPNASQKTS
jgi:(p)ppGpp synthase/HD superfamily hydrolase